MMGVIKNIVMTVLGVIKGLGERMNWIYML